MQVSFTRFFLTFAMVAIVFFFGASVTSANEPPDLEVSKYKTYIYTNGAGDGIIFVTVTDWRKSALTDGVSLPLEVTANGKTVRVTPTGIMSHADSAAMTYNVFIKELGLTLDGKSYSVVFRVDPDNTIDEEDGYELNNTYTTKMKMQAILPDFAVVPESLRYTVDFDYPYVYMEVEDLNKVANEGTNLDLLVEANGKGSGYAAKSLSQTDYKQSYKIDLSRIGLDNNGDHVRLTFTADYWSLVLEEDEENNSYEVDVVLAESIYHPVLIKLQNTPNVYLADVNNIRHFIPNEEIFYSWGYTWGRIIEMESFESFPLGESLKFRDGTLIKSTEAPVYVVTDNGQVTWIPTEEMFLALQYKWEDVVAIDDAEFSLYEKLAAWNSTDRHPNGTLIQYEGESSIYLLENGMKRVFPNSFSFDVRGYSYNKIFKIDASEVYQDGASMEL